MNSEAIAVAKQIADKLSHTWEDEGIGSYEFWGCRGNDVNWQPVLNTGIVSITLPVTIETIPVLVKGTYVADSSGDAHHTSDEVSLNFVAELATVTYGDKSYIVRYTIEEDER